MSGGAGATAARVTRIDVTLDSGWHFQVWDIPGGGVNLDLDDPDGKIRYAYRYCPSIENAIESATDFLRVTLGLPVVATALKYSALAEVRT